MSLVSFWLPAAGLSVLVVGLVALGLYRGARARAGDPGTKRELRVYAAQLKEIDRDEARGLVSADEAERLRAETARRLLEADRHATAETTESPAPMKYLALALVLAVPLAAGAFYLVEGAPGYEDLPLAERLELAREARAARPPQAQMEAQWQASPEYTPPPPPAPEFAQLMDRLRAVLAERPDDLTGLRLLAVNEANLGNFSASADAWARIVEVQGPQAPVEDMVALVETMVQAAGGRVSPEADTVLEAILRRDPTNGPARYYMGLSLGQTGRPDLTFRLWRGLLEDSPPDAPWVPIIRSEIEALAQIAGVRYQLPPLPGQGGLRGPSAGDVAAAAEMSAEERQDMIRGMVEGLAERLANEGGTPEEWARLITALSALNETERARAIWAEAQQTFADAPEALATIAAAARRAGVAE